MQLRFVKSESTFTYFEATRGYLEKHGKPLALYSDKASVFRINNKNATGSDGYTQFGRAMHELNIQTICANTSSAKGRVSQALPAGDGPSRRRRKLHRITERINFVIILIVRCYVSIKKDRIQFHCIFGIDRLQKIRFR